MSDQAIKTNYWLFQANPQVLRLADALRAGALDTFAVKQHRKRIRPGDKVILWQTGPEAGCYALATVLAEPAELDVPPAERPYHRGEIAAGWRVPLSIDYNLWNKPVTAEILPPHPAFEHFHAGLPGTNYQATAEQYALLLKTIQELDLVLEPEPEYGLPPSLSHPLNLILYGPPGTGKTYQTVNHALSIIENRPLVELALEPRSALRRRFEEYLGAGQIAFVTFHPAFSYEDFVEGIKPVSQDGALEYQIEDGLLKSIANDARNCFLEALLQAQPLQQQIEFHQLYKNFLQYLQSDAFQYFTTPDDKNVFLQRVLRFGDLSVRKAQSFAVQTVQRSRLQKLYRHVNESGAFAMSEPAVRRLLDGGNPYIYWAVLNELQSFEERYRSTLETTAEAVSDPESLIHYEIPPVTAEVLAQCRRYVLIIDEINRGNIPSIFGELISLLEADKREGGAEALAAVLPYSKEVFSLPPNLYLIGTMNSADRSVAQMDMALRRRFAFRELLPEPERLSRSAMAAGIDLQRLLTAINLRISALLGRDYQIGHAYFLPMQTLDDIKKGFSRQILPLLQEYFYDDLGKVGLILGRDFVEEIPAEPEHVFADFPRIDLDDYGRRRQYRLRPVETLTESAFIHIYDETYRHDR